MSHAEFQVNTYTKLNQANAALAMDAEGNFVVVWSSYGQDDSSNGIFGQRFDPNCIPIGSEFQINTTTTGNQTEPAVAMDAAGNFIVTWQGPGPNEEDIFARCFNSSGQPMGQEFLVNSHTKNRQLYPSIATSNTGKFIIVWENNDVDSGNNKISVSSQLYNFPDIKVGSEFTVDNKQYDCRYPNVAINESGNFVVVWMQDRTANSIMARLYSTDGNPKTEPFEVTTTRFSSTTCPSVEMSPDGHFVITWDGDPNSASNDDIHARLYQPDGTSASEQLVVNITQEGAQQWPQVAMNNKGEFVIVWEGESGFEDNGTDIFAQRYNSLGQPIGDEFQINTYVIDDQRYPVVALKDTGKFITAWQSYNQDGSYYGIFAEIGRMFEPADFTKDGFVNFNDFSILASQWRDDNPIIADLIDDNRIDERDLAEFCEQWLMPGH
jgi:hypothetical protein